MIRTKTISQCVLGCYGAVMATVAFSQITSNIESLDIITPRPFGYSVGDTIEHEMRLTLSQPFTLVHDSLPRGGRLNRWLELEPPEIHTNKQAGSTVYEILFTYHILYVGQSLERVTIQGYQLSVATDQQTLPVFIPEWSFTVAPIAPPIDVAAKGFMDLRPARAPRMATRAYFWRTLSFAAGLMAALGYLIHAYWGFNLLRRRNRPFATSLRYLKRLRDEPLNLPLYRQAMRQLHLAFNQTFGSVVFSQNLHNFFLLHPEFTVLRERIGGLFELSEQEFFGLGTKGKPDPHAMNELLALCADCRDCERGLK